MSFISVLKDIGKAPMKVIQWLGTPAGQMDTSIVESSVEAIVPASVGIVNIFNRWLQEAVKIETIAGAAAAGSVTGAQKAAAVIATLTPEITVFCAANGYDVPDAAKILEANNMVVALLNLFGKSKA